MYAQYQPINDVIIKTTFSPTFSTRRRGEYYGGLSSAQSSTYNASTNPTGTSSATVTRNESFSYTWDTQVNYVKTVKEDHSFNAMALLSVYSTEAEKYALTGEGVTPKTLWYNMGSAKSYSDIESSYGKATMLSYALRLNYAYKGRYLATISSRWDGSSKFQDGHRWGSFPSAALAWRISEESFIKDKAPWISNLKLRGSFGATGNNASVGNYETMFLANQLYYSSFGKGYGPEVINELLSWEKTTELNFGLDFGFFNGRLSGTIDWYNKTSKDLLMDQKLLLEQGSPTGTMTANVGKVRNSGIELMLKGVLLQTKNFYWDVTATFAKNKNEILELQGKKEDMRAERWFIGQPIDVYYDYQFDGIYQYEDFDKITAPDGTVKYELKKTYDTDGDGIPDKALSRTDNVEPGFIKVKDINNDGIINSDDRVVIKKDPDYVASISSNLYFKGFDLYLDFYTVQGATLQNEYFAGESLQGKLNAIKVDYWTPENPSNVAPRPRFQSQPIYNSTRSYQDASYFRLRTISLGYTFPRHLTEKININNLKIYCTGTNLLTFTKFKSYSPELTPGSYPESKQVIFGLNVSF